MRKAKGENSPKELDNITQGCMSYYKFTMVIEQQMKQPCSNIFAPLSFHFLSPELNVDAFFVKGNT